MSGGRSKSGSNAHSLCGLKRNRWSCYADRNRALRSVCPSDTRNLGSKSYYSSYKNIQTKSYDGYVARSTKTRNICPSYYDCSPTRYRHRG